MNKSATVLRRLHLRTDIAVFFITVLAVIAENYRSYRSFFHWDDFDTLGWTPLLKWSAYLHAYLSFRFLPENFRPVGHAYYRLMDGIAHFSYAPWVVGIQVIFVISAVLLWRVLAQMKFRPLTSAVGCALLVLHPSLFDGYWRPMFVFDAACALFVLASVLSYLHNRWFISLIAFYTAYRCKEMAVMLPLVFAVYEVLFGTLRWKRLLPFFALSLCFGIQALLYNRSAPFTIYSFIFSLDSLRKTLPFYSAAALAFRWSALIVTTLVLISRDRRGYFGIAAFWVLVVPLLFLPGRMFPVYSCVPMVGMIIAIASMLELYVRSDRLTLILFLGWIAFSGVKMRKYAPREIADVAESRAYVSQLDAELRRRPSRAATFVYSALPVGMNSASIQSVINNMTRTNADVVSLRDVGQATPDQSAPSLLLDWNPRDRRLRSIPVDLGPLQYVKAASVASTAQLLDGWYGVENGIRWTAPQATARLARPQTDAVLRVTFYSGPALGGQTQTLQVAIDGEILGKQVITEGLQTAEWHVKTGLSKSSTVAFMVTPALKAPGDFRELGIAMVEFGFVAHGSPP